LLLLLMITQEYCSEKYGFARIFQDSAEKKEKKYSGSEH